MNATLGDFFAAAQQHMTAASYLSQPRLATGQCVAAIGAARQLSSITAQMWEFLSVPASTNQARERLFLGLADLSTVGHLRTADDLLQHSVEQMQHRAVERDDPLAMHLAAAAQMLGIGLDLLRTHYSIDADGTRVARSDWARAIDSLDVQHALLHEITVHGLHLADVLERILPTVKRRRLPEAATVQAAIDQLRHLPDALPMVTAVQHRAGGHALLSTVPPRPSTAPVHPTEHTQTPEQLCQDIIDNAESLRALYTDPFYDGDDRDVLDIRQWQRIATGGAILSHTQLQLCHALSARALRLGARAGGHPQQLRAALADAHGVSERSVAAWRGVSRAWTELLTDVPVTARSTAEEHVEHLVIRMGRLLYANPRWTPARRDAAPAKDPADVAPSTETIAAISMAMYHVNETMAVVARTNLAHANDAMLAHDMLLLRSPRIAKRLRRTAPAPSVYQQARTVLASYRSLISDVMASSSVFGQAALLATPPERRSELVGPIMDLQRRSDRRALARMFDDADEQQWPDQQALGITQAPQRSAAPRRGITGGGPQTGAAVPYTPPGNDGPAVDGPTWRARL
ncbi:hypothetical protein HS048_34755 [Planomonospora sp. ID91781]|uniref:hypothetical protein n=1 Tax=Planomonospora sp. ID91781 TaxID=2738135 RepID=UPI0018C3C6F7|nr:hypothetical protein [Planomonospora sp. ID91781]MBG0825846.1 hypothetical protein [Planomonospora sp. ID91781]